MASGSKRRIFSEAPEAPPEVTFRGIKMFFLLQFQYKKKNKKKHLQTAIKHL